MLLLRWPRALAAFFVCGASASYSTETLHRRQKTPSSAIVLAPGATLRRRLETDEINKRKSMCPDRTVTFLVTPSTLICNRGNDELGQADGHEQSSDNVRQQPPFRRGIAGGIGTKPKSKTQ